MRIAFCSFANIWEVSFDFFFSQVIEEGSIKKIILLGIISVNSLNSCELCLTKLQGISFLRNFNKSPPS